uniref:Homing endonuclease LAGLIDADG domain-containing protein n=1 Tax=Pichia kluyveri TaxID=36015 RepID=S5U4C6_PICKL|nr:hypothetical protein [Pichia kluyveri]AGS44213.1 hypothetical protein [Pichia kluyveri]
MTNNIKLIKEINTFVSKLNMTPLIKDRLTLVLMRYEYCRENKLNSYDYILEDINKKDFNSHLVGFIDGDGCMKTGKRLGPRKGIYRIVPNIIIKIIAKDYMYLNLIIREVFPFSKKKTYANGGENTLTLSMSSKEDVKLIMDIIDENNGFLSQKRSRTYENFKELVNYVNTTQYGISHDEIWLNKGMEIWSKELELENRETKEKELDYINKNININKIMGFIEAEGSLVLHHNNTKNNIWISFEITQNTENDLILHGILNYINNLNDKSLVKENIELESKGIVYDKGKSRKNQLSRISITNNEYLYYKIIPMLLSTNMYTKMQINLVYFILGVVICKDLKNIPECRELYLKIKESINTNTEKLLDLNEILLILNKYL